MNWVQYQINLGIEIGNDTNFVVWMLKFRRGTGCEEKGVPHMRNKWQRSIGPQERRRQEPRGRGASPSSVEAEEDSWQLAAKEGVGDHGDEGASSPKSVT